MEKEILVIFFFQKKTDLSAEISSLNEYLKNQDLKQNPLSFENSSMIGIIAPNLDLPYTNFNRANLEKAIFVGTNFEEANFNRANLVGTNFAESNFNRAYLEEANFNRAYLIKVSFESAILPCANFVKANLQFANFNKAYLAGANFSQANLLEATLNKAIALGNAFFYQTEVTQNQANLIERLIVPSELFKIQKK